MARQKQMMQEKARKEREDAKRQLLLGVEASGGQSADMRIFLAQQKGGFAILML